MMVSNIIEAQTERLQKKNNGGGPSKPKNCLENWGTNLKVQSFNRFRTQTEGQTTSLFNNSIFK